MLAEHTNTNDVYRSAVSTGRIFWALGVLREVLGLLTAECDAMDRDAMVDVFGAWCTALRTRPRKAAPGSVPSSAPGLLDRAAAVAVASFLVDVSEVRGNFDEKMHQVVDAIRAHVPVYERAGLAGLAGLTSITSITKRGPRCVCFCRARGCERNENFVWYALRYAGVNPDGCGMCPVRPLHYALGTKNDFMVRELLACGADVNATGPGLSTSMHWAATAEHMLGVLKAGFHPSAMASVTNGGTVWEYHAKRGTDPELRAAVARSRPARSKSKLEALASVESVESSKSARSVESVGSVESVPHAKRRRVRIEVVPREELVGPFLSF